MRSVVTSQNVKDLIDRVAPSIVDIQVRQLGGQWIHNGTGFAVSAAGQIATCHHVIDGWPEYMVQLSSGGLHHARMKIMDAKHDLVVLEIDAHLRPLGLGALGKVELGQEVMWFGYPRYSYLLSIHKGMASYVGPLPVGYDGIQLDGSVNKGYSGGPIIDLRDGRVVGIVGSTLGGIDERLAALSNYEQSAKMLLGGIDVGATLIGIIRDLPNLIQLGVGYGIGVEYLSALIARTH